MNAKLRAQIRDLEDANVVLTAENDRLTGECDRLSTELAAVRRHLASREGHLSRIIAAAEPFAQVVAEAVLFRGEQMADQWVRDAVVDAHTASVITSLERAPIVCPGCGHAPDWHGPNGCRASGDVIHAGVFDPCPCPNIGDPR